MPLEQNSWEAAVRHLFEDAYPYDATGPRRHKAMTASTESAPHCGVMPTTSCRSGAA
ncbi:hypothetical protein [Streptomyces californicus]